MKNRKSKQTRPNPFTSAETSKTRHGLKSEARVSKKMGSTLMVGSGSKDGRKSDAVLDTKGYQFRIESKATKNKSFGLKLEILEKIRKEALDTGRVPLLTVSFTNELGQAVHNGDYVVMPMTLFNEVFND
ncbi:hypothetical protein [Vibrio phage V-YDF132]|nr:hypothetical protein [Vibrio phage V-YDF132]